MGVYFLIFEFLLNIVTGLAQLLVIVPTAVSTATLASGYVFAPLSACILAVVALAVVKLIVGRDNA